MATPFVFSNFAVSSLELSVDATTASIKVPASDVAKFPSPVGGTKFPLILQDASGIDDPEILYGTAIDSSGYITVQRGQEGTTPKSWLSGTLVQHTFTAASLVAIAKLNPRGTWSNLSSYDPMDIAVHLGISYVATQASVNQVPSSASAYWMVLYQPPGALSTALTWVDRWNSSTTYPAQGVVEHSGRIWVALSSSLNQAPSDASSYWRDIALSSTTTRNIPLLLATGPNNYTASVTDAPNNAPLTVYDGMRFAVNFATTNTGAITLAISGLPPIALRPKKGTDFAAGQIDPNEIYEFQYLAGTSEAVSVSHPGVSALITALTNRVVALESSLAGVPASIAAETAARIAADATLTTSIAARLPAGTVAMWSGTLGNIPAGWALCDGTSGTPDLRGKFILGAGPNPTYLNPGVNGGVASVTPTITVNPHALSASEIPAHTHSIPALSLSGTASFTEYYNPPSVGFANAPSPGFAGGGPYQYAVDAATVTFAHSGSVTGTTAGNTTGSAGSGGSHSHTATSSSVSTIPPYFTLCYIMKL